MATTTFKYGLTKFEIEEEAGMVKLSFGLRFIICNRKDIKAFCINGEKPSVPQSTELSV